jgi:hypothetical protein
MKMRWILLAAGAAGVTGCSQGTENQANAAANAVSNAASAKKHPTYCFFAEGTTKGWKASRDTKGNVVVKGTATLEDRRYKASLGDPEIAGTVASLWLTMPVNDTGMGARDNSWDLSATVPDSAAVESVKVMCGKKTLADLPLKK